jgi:peptide/nickel transport system permease protein
MAYIIRRILLVIPVMFGVVLFTFIIVSLTPGDPVKIMLGSQATPELVEQLREELGYNDPLPVQFVHYLTNLLKGDWGTSIRSGLPVLDEILIRFPATVKLTLFGITLAVLMGISGGLLSVFGKSKIIQNTADGISILFISIPIFWFAMLLIWLFGVKLGWVSVIGDDSFRDLILPSFTLAVGPAAIIAKLTRSSMLEVFGEDYVRTARAKGISELRVIIYHVLRNSLISVVTLVGLQFAGMLGGAVFIENVFGRTGIGSFAVSAISARDFPQIQGIVLFIAAIYVLINLAVDLLYSLIDPRIRLE